MPKIRSAPRSTLQPPDRFQDDSTSSEPLSSPVHISQSSSRQLSGTSSPFSEVPQYGEWGQEQRVQREEVFDSDLGFENWNDQEVDDHGMPSDLRPSYHRPTDGRSQTPLLGSKADAPGYDSPTRPALLTRRSTFHERDPITQATYDTRKRYTYAAIFLALSLVSFTVQTETAVYIQHQLEWEKPYCML